MSSMAPIVEGDATSFIQGLPAQAATAKTEALMLPTDKQPGEAIDVDFGGLTPSTRYWVGVRAVDDCNRAGPARRGRDDHQQDRLHDAAPGLAVQGPVLHRHRGLGLAARDRGVGDAPRPRSRSWPSPPVLRSRPTSTGGPGPAAAAFSRRSDTARALAAAAPRAARDGRAAAARSEWLGQLASRSRGIRRNSALTRRRRPL